MNKSFRNKHKSKAKVKVASVRKQTVCVHFELLKYDVLSEYPTTFKFASLLNEYQLVFLFRSFAIDKWQARRSKRQSTRLVFHTCEGNFT